VTSEIRLELILPTCSAEVFASVTL